MYLCVGSGTSVAFALPVEIDNLMKTNVGEEKGKERGLRNC